MIPQVNEDDEDKALLLVPVIAAIERGSLSESCEVLKRAWSFERHPQDKRKAPTIADQVKVFNRDQFHCQYCGKRTVFLGALVLLSQSLGEDFPYHKNWKRGKTHPAFYEISASCDHLLPISRGGDNSQANLVTSCWKCNSIKSDWKLDELRWEKTSQKQEPWDGFVGFFVKAMQKGLIKDRYWAKWYRCFNQ